METLLKEYQLLSALQRHQVKEIELKEEQKGLFGDIHGVLHTLRARPASDIQGYALLVDGVPRGFFILKRRTLLPAWAKGSTATFQALTIDRRYQGLGLGKWCMQTLPGVVRELWPEIEQLMLAVDPANRVACLLYQASGWRDCDASGLAGARSEQPMLLKLT